MDFTEARRLYIGSLRELGTNALNAADLIESGHSIYNPSIHKITFAVDNMWNSYKQLSAILRRMQAARRYINK